MGVVMLAFAAAILVSMYMPTPAARAAAMASFMDLCMLISTES